MTRISLKEAYDNRDVIAQIARLNDIVEDLPNPDLTNVVLKTGNQIIDGVKQFNDQVILAGGMDLTALGPTTITGDLDISGDLQVDGDIIQTGAADETHAEQVFSKNDYLVMRDEAVSALAAGSYSGLQVKKYDGTNDCRLVVDNLGVARVGDINDEQPLATRDEVADMTSGDVVRWDGVNKKLITSAFGRVQTASTSGFTLNFNTGEVMTGARITVPEAGTYFAFMTIQYRLANTPADNIVATGVSVSGTQIYTQNIYPAGATGLVRASGGVVFTTTESATVDPLVYRTAVSPGQTTNTDTSATLTVIRIA